MANTCLIPLHGQYSTSIQTLHQSVLVVFYFPTTSLQAHWEDHTTTLDPTNAFAIRIPRGKRHQHINTHEMRAVLQSFKRWQPIWGRGVVVIHTDNTATLSGLNKESIRGPSI